MKTTIEIPDRLLEEAKKIAAREATTVKALVEEGLRKVVSEKTAKKGAFHLRKATFRGQGLQPPLGDASWDRIRDLAYEGRGA